MKKALLWAVGALVAFLAFGAVVGNTPEAKEKAHARDVIDICWKDQSRKSLDPGAQRFIASTCEGLEADFVRKYGHKP